MQTRLDDWLVPAASNDEEAEAASSESVRGTVPVEAKPADDYDVEAELDEAIKNATT